MTYKQLRSIAYGFVAILCLVYITVTLIHPTFTCVASAISTEGVAACGLLAFGRRWWPEIPADPPDVPSTNDLWRRTMAHSERATVYRAQALAHSRRSLTLAFTGVATASAAMLVQLVALVLRRT